MARPFSLLIKPVSADCNQRCAYCFYLPKARLYPDTPRHRMTPEVLERLVTSYLGTKQVVHAFGWQGGEPGLAGRAFYREVTRLQRRHGVSGTRVSNGLQTNATLVDEPLARHLARYGFLVGVSLDGPPDIHDHYRRDLAGGPTHARVMEGVALLRRYGVEHNVLTVVTPVSAGRGREIYRYLVDQGFLYHQYIPCVEWAPDGSPASFAVSPSDWGRFLGDVFDAWRERDVGRVSVRLFDALLTRLHDGRTDLCTLGKACRDYFLVEHNGDVYPCDFYAEPGLRLGNILSQGWEDLRASPVYTAFAARKSAVASACRACPWYTVCGGDCPRHRRPEEVSYLCEGWKAFYARAMPVFRELLRRVPRAAGSTAAR